MLYKKSWKNESENRIQKDFSMYSSISIEIDAHSGANQIKFCTLLNSSMKQNGVCVGSADGRQDRMSDNCWYVIVYPMGFSKSTCEIFGIYEAHPLE